eukprot:525301_1
MTKATEYMQSNKVKKIKVIQVTGQQDPLKYGIKNGSGITIQHIMCIILYTDWTDLSCQYSKTFRKTSANQSINYIKQRNSEYAIWSRLMRETIQYYGHKRYGDIV